MNPDARFQKPMALVQEQRSYRALHIRCSYGVPTLSGLCESVSVSSLAALLSIVRLIKTDTIVGSDVWRCDDIVLADHAALLNVMRQRRPNVQMHEVRVALYGLGVLRRSIPIRFVHLRSYG